MDEHLHYATCTYGLIETKCSLTCKINSHLECHSLKSIINFPSLEIGSFLVVVMKMVSLAFDLDNLQRGSVDSNKPVALHTPDFMEYASYCVFPGTTVFGPFITYSEHIKFLSPTPLVSRIVVALL